MKCSAFYLVSTPLHLLISIAVALSKENEEKAKLLFVAQEKDNERMDFFRKSVVSWQGSPFEEVLTFYRPSDNKRQKVLDRQETFVELQAKVKKDLPDRVYVGNDRHLEFQWVMHQTKKLKPSVCGIYLDEGLYSYINRKSSRKFSERIIDNVIKKIAYGLWWETPPSIGGSTWVKKAVVAYPDLVHRWLKSKEITAFDSELFENEKLDFLSQDWLGAFSVNKEQLEHCDVVITFPEYSDMAKVDGYFEDARELIKNLSNIGMNVAIKHHPKDLGADLFNISSMTSVTMLPANLPFEIMLSVLPKGCYVLGDMSSTVLTTRLFRKDIDVIVMKLGKESGHFGQFVELYRNLKLQPKTSKEIMVQIKSK